MKNVTILKCLFAFAFAIIAITGYSTGNHDVVTLICGGAFMHHDADLDDFYASVLNPMGAKVPIVEDAELLLGASFDKNKSTLTFNLFDSSTKLPYERRLLEQDLFRVTHLAGEFWKVDETTDKENYAVTPFTYPEAEVFVGVKATKTELSAMEVLYSGVLNLLRSRTELIKDYPMRSLLVAPERQQHDGKYYNTVNDDRYKRLTIQPCFGGKGTMSFTIDLAPTTAELMELLVGNLDAAGAVVAGQKNHFIMRLRGFRAVNQGEAFKAFREAYCKANGIRE
jgi:hypothetical protein